jgi:hypothetical protein
MTSGSYKFIKREREKKMRTKEQRSLLELVLFSDLQFRKWGYRPKYSLRLENNIG